MRLEGQHKKAKNMIPLIVEVGDYMALRRFWGEKTDVIAACRIETWLAQDTLLTEQAVLSYTVSDTDLSRPGGINSSHS